MEKEHVLILHVLESAHSVGTTEEHRLTFEKLTEKLQGFLSFLLLTGINALTAVEYRGQGRPY